MSIAIIILVVLAIFIVFFLSWVELSIAFKKGKDDTDVRVSVKYLFIKKEVYPKKKSDKSKTQKKPKEEKTFLDYKKQIEEYLAVFEELKEDIIKILKYANDRLIVFKNIDFFFKFGLDDPMSTGILNGIIYAGVYNVLGVIHNNMTIENCSVDIVPDFDNVCHDVNLNCILKLKNVHIILMIVKTVRLYSKFKNIKKRGSNKNGRTSYSGTNGSGNVQH